MSDRQFVLGSPEWLRLLAIVAIPLLWMMRQSLAALSSTQRWFAVGLRILIVTLVAFALAEPHWQELVERVGAVFVIDHSGSTSPQV